MPVSRRLTHLSLTPMGISGLMLTGDSLGRTGFRSSEKHSTTRSQKLSDARALRIHIIALPLLASRKAQSCHWMRLRQAAGGGRCPGLLRWASSADIVAAQCEKHTGPPRARPERSIPAAASSVAAAQLRSAGFAVELEIEAGVGHTVSPAGARRALTFVQQSLSSRPC